MVDFLIEDAYKFVCPIVFAGEPILKDQTMYNIYQETSKQVDGLTIGFRQQDRKK